MDELTPARWKQVRALFDDALDRPPAERAAFLEAACGGDDALRAEVESLLAAEAEDDTLLEAPVGVQAGGLVGAMLEEQVAAEADAAAGRRVGPYRLLRELGRGGMGAVYLAERADGHFEQRVALKLIKRGMDSDFVLQRFLRERQILARLQHPNIARLLDGGVSDEGQPFFAMEYVDGLPLPAYCDAHGLSVEDRLRLFTTVGEAVHYAHRNLVVHRDLKPGNILVTGDGTVKLLDFGIAKLLEDDEADGLTQTGVRLMTPAYAAPEQVRGEPVTTATDVYALGVLLYELLTGQRPFGSAGPSPDDVARAVLDASPTRPSSVVVKSGAATSGATSERLRRRLAGDLDVICLMALRKEPERRYPSAEAFVEDVRRHLSGLPVIARPDTAGYRAGKFIRRHKLGLGAAALVLVSLVGGLAAALWQAAVARRERNEKQLEATRANVTRDYVVGLFEHIDPEQARGRRFTARELIEPGIRRLESLKDQPLEQAVVMRALGQVSLSAGLVATADSLFREALARQQERLPADDLEIAATLEEQATARLLLQDYAGAQQRLEQALAIRAKAYGAADARLLKTLNQLAYAYLDAGRPAEAEARYRQALALRAGAAASFLPEVARSLRGLADVFARSGRPGEAMPLFEEALALYERTHGVFHSETGRALHSLAEAYHRQGDYARADSLFRRALQINRQIYGAEHHHVASNLYQLGAVQEAAGATDAAARYYQDAATVFDRVLPGAHVYKALPLSSLGTMLLRQGQADEAEAPLRRALSVYEEALPPADPTLLQSRLDLAACLFRRGDYGGAEALLRRNDETLAAHADTTAAVDRIREQTARGLARVSEARGGK